jgi:hypothetical protein
VVEGVNGQLFAVVDDLTDSLLSVNDISGLPILEVFATDKVVMGKFGLNTLVVNSDKVGIGIATPSVSLEVNGTIAATLFSGKPGVQSDVRIRGNSAAGDVVLNNGDGRHVFIYNGASTVTAAFTSDGKVGIGTSAPGEKLTIIATANVTTDILKIRDNSLTEKFVVSLDSAGIPYISFNSYGYLRTTANANQLFLASSGNIGIGTATTGTDKLRVEGDGPVVRINATTNGGNLAQLKLSWDGSDTHGLAIGYSAVSAESFIDAVYPKYTGMVYGDIRFRRNVASVMTDTLIIKGDTGFVGIGTTTPFAKVTIPSGETYNGMYGIEAAASSNSRRWWIHTDYIAYGDFSISTESSKQQGVNPDLSRFYINGAGNVGIGTTTPSDILQIYGANGAYYKKNTLTLTESNGSSTGSMRFSPNMDGAGGYITFNGNVVTNTSGTLVSGTSTITGDHSGRRIGALQYRAVGDSSSGFDFMMAPYGTAQILTTVMTIQQSGNVGIGITAPEDRLSFDTPVYYNSAASTSGISFKAYDASIAKARIQPFFGGTGAAVQLTLGSNAYLNTSGLVDRYDNAIASSLLRITQFGIFFYSGDETADAPERITIKTSGNVGIGNTNPTSKLEVGSVTSGGNVTINATEGAEMAPTLVAGNWTATGGASVGSNVITLTGAGSVTPSGSFPVVAGKIYKVVITVSASANYSYYTLGSSSGREPFGTSTYTEYLTASDTAKIIITAVGSGVTTISSISVKELTSGTGDFVNYGKLIAVNGLFDKNGTKVIDISSSGNIGIGMNSPGGGYKLAVGGIMQSSGYYGPFFTNSGTTWLYLNEQNYTGSFRNSTNQSILRVYNTYTDSSNYERASVTGVAGSSINISAESAGTGAANLSIAISPKGTGVVSTTSALCIDNAATDLKIRFSRTGGNLFSIEHDAACIYMFNGTTGKPSMLWNNDSNVRIGTNDSSIAKFSIDWAAAGVPSAVMLKMRNSLGTNTPYAQFELEHADSHMLELRGRSGGASESYIMGWNLNTGNVGIGTTSPGHKLHINQSGASTTSNILYFTHENIVNSNLWIGTCPSNTTVTAFQNNNIFESYAPMIFSAALSGNYLSFGTGRTGATFTETMRITGTNVGIGTPSPADKLDVVGYIRVGISTEKLSFGSNSFGFNRRVENGDIFNSGASAYQFQHMGNASPASDYLALQVYNSAGGAVTTNALVVNGAGNVGIGTTAPNAKLHVIQSGTPISFGADGNNAAMFVEGAYQSQTDAGNLAVFTNDTLAADKGGSIILGGKYLGSSVTTFGKISSGKDNSTSGEYGGYLAFHTRINNAVPVERLRISSAGFIGIGTSTPTNTISFGVGEKIIAIESTDGSDTGALVLQSATVGTPGRGSFIGLYGTDHATLPGRVNFSGGSGGAIVFHAQPATTTYERMRITPAGNVGIGTASPGALLEVAGVGNAVIATVRADRGVSINIYDDTIQSVGTPLFLNYYGLDTNIGTQGTVVIKASGKVGIGVADPVHKLDIGAGSVRISSAENSYTALMIANSGTGSAVTYYDAIDGDFSGGDYGFIGQHYNGYMEYNIGAGSPMPYHVFAGGNVGIGTNTPLSLLQVGNTGASDVANVVSRVTIVGSTEQSQTPETILRLERTVSSNLYYPATVDFKLSAYQAGGVGVNYNPATKLTIALKNQQDYNLGADVDVLTLQANGNVGIGTTSPQYLVHINSTDPRIIMTASGSGTTASDGSYWRQNGVNTIFGNQETGDLQFFVDNTGTRGIYIKSGGNVGIGTITPGYALDVVGDTNISGHLYASVKHFRAEDPTNPNHYITYSSLEGPENAVFYRGKVNIKDNIYIIKLPKEWDWLVNRDSLSVYLSSEDDDQHLSYSIYNDTIKIKNNKMMSKHIKCSYLIMATRKDIKPLEVYS